MRIVKFIYLFLILGFPLTCLAAPRMTVITEENPPFNYSENGQVTGASTAVVREIMHRLGIAGSIAVQPWARGYKQLRTEPNVVLFTTARTEERERRFHWVGPLYVLRLQFYARKNNTLHIDGLEAAKQVGAIGTYKDDYREQLLTSLGFTNLDSSKNPLSNVRKLMSGRDDLWFFDNIGAPRLAVAAGIDPEDIESVFTYRQHLSYIAISKQTEPAIVRQWQRALDDMKADGSFWWLTRKWLPADAITMESRPESAPSPLKLYTEDAPPSAFMENGRLNGFSVEIVREILRRIGQPDTIEMVPWARGYKRASAEANTALFSTTRLPQREPLFSWVGPLYRQRWGFYRWKGSDVRVDSMDAAKGVRRIGTYRQDAKMQYLQVKGFDNLVPTNKNINNLIHLKKGNIDLWVSSDFNMPHMARYAGISPDQVELAYAFHTVGNYIAFSKSTSPHVVRLWQAVLDDMKADGSYRETCLKYGIEPK